MSRPGIVALDPVNGMPYAWNPGKDRGVAVWDLHLSDHGLYVGSDTDFTAGEYHAKLAEFPLAGGAAVPVATPDQLPALLYTGSVQTTTVQTFSGTTFGTPSNAGVTLPWRPAISDAWWEADQLYTIENGQIVARSFDGVTLGGPVTQPSWTWWLNVTAATWAERQADLQESGSNSLKYRYFSLEAGSSAARRSPSPTGSRGGRSPAWTSPATSSTTR
ncbi:MAG: hypothetical protein R2705_15180 [Ilumatobacteraceae bacterium]